MKIISIVVPTYNEENNVQKVYERIVRLFLVQLCNYDFELLFADNYSTDQTRAQIEDLCQKDKRVKAIFNARNFGFTRSTYYALLQSTGDASVLMFADMQDPPEAIPDFVRQWENGSTVVVGVKASTKEGFFITRLRGFYYWLVKKICEIEHIEYYNGFGLYDKSFLNILRNMNDHYPYFRGIVAELAPKRTVVKYEHQDRKEGKTHMNFFSLYDVAMAGITSYSKLAMRCATFFGAIIGCLAIIFAAYTFIRKILFWDSYPLGYPSLFILISLVSAFQLFFIGLVGEYVVSISIRSMNHPLIVEEKRINFDKE